MCGRSLDHSRLAFVSRNTPTISCWETNLKRTAGALSAEATCQRALHRAAATLIMRSIWLCASPVHTPKSGPASAAVRTCKYIHTAHSGSGDGIEGGSQAPCSGIRSLSAEHHHQFPTSPHSLVCRRNQPQQRHRRERSKRDHSPPISSDQLGLGKVIDCRCRCTPNAPSSWTAPAA
jgi:hypothetical protein